jgi:hypothetical protein
MSEKNITEVELDTEAASFDEGEDIWPLPEGGSDAALDETIRQNIESESPPQ